MSAGLLPKLRARKHLNPDALYQNLRQEFEKIPDPSEGTPRILLKDFAMSGFAMFSLKEPSLLAFDKRRKEENNLGSIFGIDKIACDTQIRERLDPLHPELFRDSYKSVFRELQRGKVLEPMVFYDDCYLLDLDGTWFYSSTKIGSDACLIKEKNGQITYQQAMLGAVVVHPDYPEVIPVFPEMIVRQDGQTKNDCERNATRRFLKKFREDHPHLNVIVNEDGLSPNAPHIRDLQKYNCHFILAAKEGDHRFLFQSVGEAYRRGQTTEYAIPDEQDPTATHLFHFVNGVPLNKSNQNLLVNFFEYGLEVDGEIVQYFSWITDFTITIDNVYTLMRGGRARWKNENEQFNTLKNQGYHFGHNFGLGNKNLSAVFAHLMMLAFLVDQVVQLTSDLFRAAWKKKGTKRLLWDRIRAYFTSHAFKSMTMLLEAIFYGIEFRAPVILRDTS